jgi:hypothetical protein
LEVIPLDLQIACGFTFRSVSNIPTSDWVFVCKTFYLSVQAVLVSWFLPWWAARWLLVDTALSAVIVAEREIQWFLEYRRAPYALTMPLPVALFFELLSIVIFFWGPNLVFGLGLAYVSSGNHEQLLEDNS